MRKVIPAAIMAAAVPATKMEYSCVYSSPLGSLLLTTDSIGLTGLWMDRHNHPVTLPNAPELPVFQETRRWLDTYFAGQAPDFLPPLHPSGTPFQRAVWEVLLSIPYGETVTYGYIAKQIGCRSSQAVGSSVGRNPISIIIPCHRCIGVNGNLTGYAGGLDKKVFLLTLEGMDMSQFFLPK